MKTLSNRWQAAWTRTDLLAVVVVGLAALALLLLLVPARGNAKKKAQLINCANNLRQIGTAFRLWAGDSRAWYPMGYSIDEAGTKELVPSGLAFPHFRALSNELGTPKLLHCPADTERTNAMNFAADLDDGKLSYFVDVDASEMNPWGLFAGDRNLTVNAAAPGRRLTLVAPGSVLGWTSSIHSNVGNILLGDASVRQFSTAGLQQYWRDNATTNRLAIP